MESHRPHRPVKISIWRPTALPQSLQSSTTDPKDPQKDYLLSIWSPTDPTDLPKLAYVVPQTYHRPCKALLQTPKTLKKIIYLVYGVPQTQQTLQSSTTDPTDLQKDYLLSIWSPTDPTDLSKLAYGVPQTSHRPCKVLQQTFKKIIDLVYGVPQTPQTFQN